MPAGVGRVAAKVGGMDAIVIHCAGRQSCQDRRPAQCMTIDRKSTRLNSSHQIISYAVFCLKKKKKIEYVRESIMREECRFSQIGEISLVRCWIASIRERHTGRLITMIGRQYVTSGRQGPVE